MKFASGGQQQQQSQQPMWSAAEKADFQEGRRKQANAEIGKLTVMQANEVCSLRCFGTSKPGVSLSQGDQKCLSSCTDRFVEATGIVAQTYITYHKAMSQAMEEAQRAQNGK